MRHNGHSAVKCNKIQQDTAPPFGPSSCLLLLPLHNSLGHGSAIRQSMQMFRLGTIVVVTCELKLRTLALSLTMANRRVQVGEVKLFTLNSLIGRSSAAFVPPPSLLVRGVAGSCARVCA